MVEEEGGEEGCEDVEESQVEKMIVDVRKVDCG